MTWIPKFARSNEELVRLFNENMRGIEAELSRRPQASASVEKTRVLPIASPVVGLQLGETDSTAYRGDRGKVAYDHSQTTGNPHGTSASDVGAAALSHAHGAVTTDGKIGSTAGLPVTTGTGGALQAAAWSTTAPVMNGTASVGTSVVPSRSDHVHPTDTTRAAATATLANNAASSTLPTAGIATALATLLQQTRDYLVGLTAKFTDGSVTKVGTASVGSTTQPIYLNAGVPTAITEAIGNSTTGNAATATKLATARTIALTGDVTGSASFDGSANASIAVTSAHLTSNAGDYTPWQTKGVQNGYTGISFPGASRVTVMSHTTAQYAGMYCESDGKWMVVRPHNGTLITDYSPALYSKTNEIATTAFVNSKLNQYEFDVTGGDVEWYANWYAKIASWVPNSGTTYFIKFQFDFFGISIYPWENKPFDAVVTFRNNNFNVYYEMVGNHEGYSRIYCGMNGTTAEIWCCGYGSSVRAVGRMVHQTEDIYTQPTSMTSTMPSYLTDMGVVTRNASNADKIDGKHVVVTAIASKGTDANTLYFCY